MAELIAGNLPRQNGRPGRLEGIVCGATMARTAAATGRLARGRDHRSPGPTPNTMTASQAR